MRIEHPHAGWWWLRYIILARVLLSAFVMYGSDTRAVCEARQRKHFRSVFLGRFSGFRRLVPYDSRSGIAFAGGANIYQTDELATIRPGRMQIDSFR
jgi:hypothetical protein